MQSTGFSFRNQLRAWRSAAGLSQAALAARCGWGQSRIGNYETPNDDQSREPRLEDLLTIGTALNVSLDALLREQPSGSFSANEERAEYRVKVSGDKEIAQKVERLVASLNEAIDRGVDAKFIDVLLFLIARESSTLPSIRTVEP